jgi:hypothetical protein
MVIIMMLTVLVVLVVSLVTVVTMMPVRIPVGVPECNPVSVSLPVVVLELPYAVACLVQAFIEEPTFFYREHIIFTKFPGDPAGFVILFFQLPGFLVSQRSRLYSTHNPLMLAFHAIDHGAIIMITSGMGRHCHEYTERGGQQGLCDNLHNVVSLTGFLFIPSSE